MMDVERDCVLCAVQPEAEETVVYNGTVCVLYKILPIQHPAFNTT
jgi:hypothetical protein